MAKKSRKVDASSDDKDHRQTPAQGSKSGKQGNGQVTNTTVFKKRVTRSSAKMLEAAPVSDDESDPSDPPPFEAPAVRQKLGARSTAKSIVNKARSDPATDSSESPNEDASDGPAASKRSRTGVTHAKTALKSVKADRGRRLYRYSVAASSDDEGATRGRRLGRPDIKTKPANRTDHIRHERAMSSNSDRDDGSHEENDYSSEKLRDLVRRLKIAEGA